MDELAESSTGNDSSDASFQPSVNSTVMNAVSGSDLEQKTPITKYVARTLRAGAGRGIQYSSSSPCRRSSLRRETFPSSPPKNPSRALDNILSPSQIRIRRGLPATLSSQTLEISKVLPIKSTSGTRAGITEDETVSEIKKKIDAYRLLWGDISRRTKFNSSPAHQLILRAMIPFFNALITSGHAVELCSPWANTQKPRLSKVMSRTWQDLAKRLGDLLGNRNVDVA